MNEDMGLCKLCLEEKELLRRSHIIPNFMYQDLYGKNHKIVKFKPHELAKGIKKGEKHSSGEYEPNILCRECDNNIIGKYENYASRVLYGGLLPKNESPTCINYKNPHEKGFDYSLIKNIDYMKMKLFLISILWRAGLSQRQLFSEIKLETHEEILRKMLLTGDPKDIHNYPIFFMTYLNDKKMIRDLIVQPQKRVTKYGHEVYIFIIAGMLYTYFLDSEIKVPDFILDGTIKPTNEMTIIKIPEGEAWNVIAGYYGLLD